MKSKLKRILSVIIGIILMIPILIMFNITVSAADVILLVNNVSSLQTVINEADKPITIIISQNFLLGGTTVIIPANANITIRSEVSCPVILTQTKGRHFTISGNLTLEDVILDGSTNGTSGTAVGGGVQVNTNGSFTLEDGAVIQNCSSSTNGGGIYGNTKSTINISGGTIKGNKSVDSGGGIYSGTNSIINLSNGTINGNISNTTDINGHGGGGVFADGTTMINMSGGEITNNINNSRGGGVMINGTGTFKMTGGLISNNQTKTAGGGIYAKNIEISGESVISNNESKLIGGGIWGMDGSQVTIGGNAEISGNYVVPSITALYGGGVAIDSNSKFTLKDNAVIKNCSASNGGGVCLVSRSKLNVNATTQFIMQDNAIITNCDAVENGGGVYVSRDQAGTDLIFTFEGGEISGNTSTYGAGIYLNNGNFIMGKEGGSNNSAIIKDNIASYMGGGVDAHNDSIFTMNCGTISGNQAISGNDLTYGGGVEAYNGSTFTMKDGLIFGNSSNDYSGGVEVYQGSTFIMEGGSITNNAAPNGGGVSVGYKSALFNMNGGEISGNAAAFYGGGIYVYSSGIMTVNSGDINGNSSTYGGGVLTTETGQVYMKDCSITNNTATANNGEGGGIYSMDRNYNNLITTEATFFDGNTAATDYMPDGDLDIMYPNIKYSKVSDPYEHPLNDFDINTKFNAPFDCHITFDSEGGNTGVPDQIVEFGNKVEKPTNPVKTGFEFLGWCIKADNGELTEQWNFNIELDVEVHGSELTLYALWEAQETTISGTARVLPHNVEVEITYSADYGTITTTDTITTDINGNYSLPVLYDSNVVIIPSAKAGYSVSPEIINITATSEYFTGNDFVYTPNNCTVTYDANGGVGQHEDAVITFNTPYTVLSSEDAVINRAGYNFTGWNSEPDKSGTNYMIGDSITITGNVTLYAQWTNQDGGTGTGTHKYSVTYNANGGTGSYTVEDITYRSIHAVFPKDTAGIGSFNNYIFNGWNTEKDGKGMAFKPGDNITIIGNVTLYAQWDINPTSSNPDGNHIPTEPSILPVEPTLTPTDTPTIPTEPSISPVEPTLTPTDTPIIPNEPSIPNIEPPNTSTEKPVTPTEPLVVPTETPITQVDKPVTPNELQNVPTKPSISTDESMITQTDTPVILNQPSIPDIEPLITQSPPQNNTESPVLTYVPPINNGAVANNTGTLIPNNLVVTDVMYVYVSFDENGIPLGYFMLVQYDDDSIAWIEVDEMGTPLGNIQIEYNDNDKSKIDNLNPKTGDNSNIFLTISLLCATVLWVLLVIKKRSTKHNGNEV